MNLHDEIAPALSVIVPSVNGAGDLVGCLDALAAEAARTPIEAVVVDRCGPAVREQMRRRHPWVRILEVPVSTGIPDMRAAGFAVARAPVVAVIEDHVLVPEGWAASLLAAQQRGEQVVAGSVRNAATTSTVDWAAFLCEYSQLLAPLPAGPAALVAGNNIAYRRELLVRFREATTCGRWEDHLHSVLREHGIELVCHPEISVEHKKSYTVREYMSQRFLYARSYAAGRLRGRSPLVRAGRGLAALMLPPVLLARIVSCAWRRPGYRRILFRSLALLPVFVSAWAAGEVAGAWLGPGDALARVR